MSADTKQPVPTTADLFPQWGEECERFARMWRERAREDEREGLVTHILGKPAAHAAALVVEMAARLDAADRDSLLRKLVSRWIVESIDPEALP